MSAELFIDRLEQKGLLDEHVVNDLRRRIAKSHDKKITPEAVAKFLVDKGHLTAFQATKLVNEVAAIQEKMATQRQPDSGSEEKPDADELQFAPDSDNDLLPIDTPPKDSPETPERTAKPNKKRKKSSGFKKRSGKKAAEIDEDDLIRLDEDAASPVHPPPKKKVKQPLTAPVEAAPEPPKQAIEPAGDLAEFEASSASTSEPLAATNLDALLRTTTPEHAAPHKLQTTNQWDSKLLLIGSASLGILIVLGAFLVLSLTRGQADEILNAANEDYNAGAYASAMKRYDQFLKYYSSNDNASHARVFRSLARLRQVYTNPEQGLRVATEILPKIEKEKAFDEARSELASMLPQIAEEFVERAKLSNDTAEQEQLLNATKKAMQLVDNPNYIPTALRRAVAATITRTREDMARVQREIDRERNLARTILAINQAVAAGKTKEAYAARQALLDKYPGLDTNERLYKAVLKITEKQRERVHVVAKPIAALTGDHAPRGKGKTLVLANRRGPGEANAAGYVTYALAGGSLFALDAATGNVLWRRFVGFESTTYPEPVAAKRAGADVIIADRRYQELQRLDAKTGKLVWRLPIGEPFAPPVITDRLIYVAANSGKVFAVDPETGTARRHVVIDQTLAVGPGVGRTEQLIYQPGEHDNLYVLAADTLECREVVYLGHKAGTIVVPPVVVLGYVIVVQNGPDYAMVHIFGTDKKGLHLKKAQTTIRLRGRVLVQPIVGRRRVLFITDRRAIALYDIDPSNTNGTPLTVTAQRSATTEPPMVSFSLLDRGYLWIANNRFTKLQVQAATGKLPSEWVKDEQDIYIAPLRLVHNLVIDVHRHQGTTGVVVAATPLLGKDPVWQTELATPILTTAVAQQQLHSITGRGRLYNLNATSFDKQVLNQAQLSAVKDDLQALYLDAAVPLPKDQWAFTQRQGYSQVVFYKPGPPAPTMRLLTLTVPRGQATDPPAVFNNGLLVPQRSGIVSLMDMVTGAEQAHPFEPEITPGTKVQWTRPVNAIGADEFYVANDLPRLYRVGLKKKPQPYLAELSSVGLEASFSSQLAVTKQLVFGVVQGATADTLQAYKVGSLEKGPKLPLNGHVHWGPIATAGMVLVATQRDLWCIEPSGDTRWKVALQHGPPVGNPAVESQQLLLATINGSVWRLDLKSGKTIASTEAGEPLASGPVLFGNKVLVASKSGTLILLPKPTP